MTIILDGYNILKQLYLPNQVLSAQRITFINKLKKYAQKKKHDIILVFDGGNSTYSTREVTDSITIIYAGIKQSADDYIIEFCNIHKTKQYLLITSDNALIKQITNNHVIVLDSVLFMQFVSHALNTSQVAGKKENNIITKIHQESLPIDELMMEAAHYPSDKIEEIKQAEVHQHGKQWSKDERKLQQLLKKL